jgi:hypothetical protein
MTTVHRLLVGIYLEGCRGGPGQGPGGNPATCAQAVHRERIEIEIEVLGLILLSTAVVGFADVVSEVGVHVQ